MQLLVRYSLPCLQLFGACKLWMLYVACIRLKPASVLRHNNCKGNKTCLSCNWNTYREPGIVHRPQLISVLKKKKTFLVKTKLAFSNMVQSLYHSNQTEKSRVNLVHKKNMMEFVKIVWILRNWLRFILAVRLVWLGCQVFWPPCRIRIIDIIRSRARLLDAWGNWNVCVELCRH